MEMSRKQSDQSHTHMKESDHLVTLAQEFWDTDQGECSEVSMWESSGFKECASDNVLIASDGSGGSRETLKNVRQVAFGVATFSLQPLSDTSFKLLRTGFLGGQVPGQTDGFKGRALGSHPNPQPCQREVEHPNSERCESM